MKYNFKLRHYRQRVPNLKTDYLSEEGVTVETQFVAVHMTRTRFLCVLRFKKKIHKFLNNNVIVKTLMLKQIFM